MQITQVTERVKNGPMEFAQCTNDSPNVMPIYEVGYMYIHVRIDLMHWRHVSITTTPCWGSRLVALRACCAGRARWRSQPLSQYAGPGQPGSMACRVWPAGCMLGDGARGSASFDPQRAGAPFCDVICIRSIHKSLTAPNFKLGSIWISYILNATMCECSSKLKLMRFSFSFNRLTGPKILFSICLILSYDNNVFNYLTQIKKF